MVAVAVGLSTVAVPVVASAAVTTPGAPQAASFTATRGEQLTMSQGILVAQWNRPFNTGGAPVTRYDVTFTRHSDGAVVGTCSVIPDNPDDPAAIYTCQVEGLPHGVEYDGSIVPTNAAGPGTPAVNDSPLLPIGIPDHPNNIGVSPGVNKFEVTWSAPTNNGGSAVTGYTVTAYDSSNYPSDLGTPITFCEVKTLPATLKCTLNPNGTSPPALAGSDWIIVVTAENVEGIGLDGIARPGEGSVATTLNGAKTAATVSWTNNPAVKDGSENSWGIATLYLEDGTVALDGNGDPLTCRVQTPASSCQITGLDPTVTYTTQVVYGVYPLAIGAPTIQPTKPVGTSDQDSQVPVTWTAAGSTVGQNYFVQAYDKNGNKVGTGDVNTPGAGSCVSVHPTTNCIVPGLTNGEPYTFVVTPYSANKKIKGTPSLLSDPATPARPPSKPLNVQQIARNGTITVTWSASADNGGADIDKYVVEIIDPSGKVVDTCTVNVGDPFSCVLGGGTLGTSTKYTVSVKAHNRINYGPPATITNVIPVLALTNTAGYKKMVVAVGDDGVIFRSRDKGNTYAPDYSGTSVNLKSVICSTSTRCITVGDAGTIKYWDGPLTDGTQSWTAAANPNTSENLKSVACGPNSLICLAVGDNGTVMLSDETDDNWTQVADAPVVDYTQVACPDIKTCIIVGAQGTLLKISAPYTTFQQLSTTPATPQDLNALRCPNPNYCIAVGDAGKLIAASAPFDNTTKASRWKQITLAGGTKDILGVACPALSKICVAVGTDGLFAATAKSNVVSTKAWKLARTPFTYDLKKVRCRTKVDCVAVADGHLTTATWSKPKKRWIVKQIT